MQVLVATTTTVKLQMRHCAAITIICQQIVQVSVIQLEITLAAIPSINIVL